MQVAPVTESAAKRDTMVRITPELLDALDEWVAELNARPDNLATVTRSDVVRRILARRLKARTPGEVP